MKVFSVYSADNQRSWHILASETKCKEKLDWSEQQEVDIGSG